MSSLEIQKIIDNLVDEDAHPSKQLEILLPAEKQFEKDAEILWRIARAYYLLCELQEDKMDEQKVSCEKGIEYAKKTLEVDPENWTGHKWYAILLSVMNNFVSLQEKAKNAMIIRKHLDIAASKNPGDVTTQFALGGWCFTIADLGFIARNALALITDDPPSASYDEAMKYFLNVEKLTNGKGWIRNKIRIGDCYYQQKDYENAKVWYQKAIDQKAISDVHKRQHEEAIQKLKKCSSWW